MSEQLKRKRPEMYYLDLARHGNYVFTADDSVYQLAAESLTKKIRVETRVPGNFVEQELVMPGDGYGDKIGTFYDLAHYRERPAGTNGYISSGYRNISHQELPKYIPADVIKNMQEWQNGIVLNKDAMCEAAAAMVASDEDLQNEQVHCSGCNDDKYACYESGYSKHLWKYPMVDIGTQGAQQLVPLDIARLLATSPDSLAIDDQYMLGDKDSLIVNRVVMLRLDNISDAYIGGDGQTLLHIDESDRNAGRTIALSIGSWSEGGTLPNGMQPQMARRGGKALVAPKDFVEELQRRVTFDGGERVELTDYDARWAEVRNVLAKTGMALTWKYGYRGMGDSDASIRVVRANDLNRGSYTASEVEGRMMIDGLYQQLVLEVPKTYSRPEYGK